MLSVEPADYRASPERLLDAARIKLGHDRTIEDNSQTKIRHIIDTSEALPRLQADSKNGSQLTQTLTERSRVLQIRYEQTWMLEDVEERIRVLRDGLALLSRDEQDFDLTGSFETTDKTTDHDPSALVTCLHQLSVALGDRYKHMGQSQDLDEQVELLQLALSAPLPKNSKLAVSIRCELGVVLRKRFSHLADSTDILEAFNIHSSLLNRHPEGDSNHARLLFELAHTLYERAISSSVYSDDLPQCISLLNTALNLFEESDFYYSMTREILAKAAWRLGLRHGGDVTSLQAASELSREFMRSRPSNHPDYWLLQFDLGESIGALYQRTNDMQHLNECVDYCRRAFDTVDCKNPNRMRAACSLVNSLNLRYARLGAIQDIHESIGVLRPCVDIPHSLHTKVISILAYTLSLRYDALGVADDLDEGIGLLRGAYSDANRARYARDLSEMLVRRYRREKRVGDITEAINLTREAVELAENGTRLYISAVFYLAMFLSEYHKDCGDREALAEAIALCETWLSRSQGEEGSLRGWILNTYAATLTLCYQSDYDKKDLDAAISYYEQALECLPTGHMGRPDNLIELAEVLRYRFEATHMTRDVERAAELLIEALGCLPDGHPDRATPLFKTARLHICQEAPFFDISTALQYASQAITYAYQNAQKRLTSALDLFENLKDYESSFQRDSTLRRALLDIYALCIDILPRVAYFGLDITSRLRVLGTSDQMAANGAAHALLLNRPQIAIELLEQGRAVFWSQHLRLRTGFHALPSELASQLSRAAYLLENGSHALATIEKESPEGDAAQELETANQRRLGDGFEALIRQARALPGFKRFMLPETFQALSAAATKGPVVVLLANDVTCQAIVIENPEIVHQVHLSQVSSQRLQTLAQFMTVAVSQGRTLVGDRALKKTRVSTSIKAEEVLAELWRNVVRRIVEVLQLKRSAELSRPRITICPTGVFAHLPLHAAGIYGKGKPGATECLSDYLVPSYIPTIGALLNARRKLSSTRAVKAKMLITAVSQPFKWTRLPYVTSEVEQLKRAVPSEVPIDFLGDFHCAQIQSSGAPTVSAVLENLPDATILHLACHGHQDSTNPLASGFVMQDSMLTVANLMALNLDKAFLAFLSACETAKGDKAHTDQAIHLAAAMLFAGFKSVVATMWSMGDVDGPIVAEIVYKELYRGGAEVLDPDTIPYALDLAIRKLRAKGLSASRWAPYVHIGV